MTSKQYRNSPVQRKPPLQQQPNPKPKLPSCQKSLSSSKNPFYSISDLLKLKDKCTDMPKNCTIPAELAVPKTSIAILRKPNVDSMESYQRNVQSLMNKISPENFESITEKLTATIATAMENLPDPMKFLTNVVETIFEKAVREFRYAESYSQLCVSLSQKLPQQDGADFKKLLLNKCQEEFETQPREPPSSDTSVLELEDIRSRLAERNNGVPQFIGALFLHGLISEKIIHYCLRTLLTLQEPDLTKFASLLTLIGKTLDHPKAKILMDAYFVKIETLSQNKAISMRVRFKLIDVVELRRNHWQSKKSLPIPPPVKSEVNKQVNLQEGR
jgi:translation initiation factor 4G